MIIVWRDLDGDAWVRISKDRICIAVDVQAGGVAPDRWSSTIAEVEANYGPLIVEWEIEEVEKPKRR